MSLQSSILAGQSQLSIQESGQLSFLLHQQHEWRHDGPLMILHYYDRQHPRAQSVSVPSGDGYAFGTAGTPSLSASGRLALQVVADGQWLAIASFHEIHVRITLRITQLENGFSISIGKDDIVESMPNLYRVLAIELLPDFGAAVTGESGYLTLPNWMGCQTRFNKNYPREVRQTIYSSNDQWEHVCNMPLFGITREQGTLCGLIANGDFNAQLVSHVHWEDRHLNGSHPVLMYRWEQQDEMIAGPREVRYLFAPPEYEGGDGYVFCAHMYRNFLRRERGLKTWAQKASTRPEALDYRDRFFLKIFMAYKEPQADGKGKYHSTCTFDEARTILEHCLNRGMKKLTAILVGWGIDGHDGMPPTRFPVDERLGGEAGLKRLIAWCKEQDIQLGVHDSYGGAYSCSPEFDKADLVRHRSGEYWESVIWSGGQCHIICPKVFIEKHVKRDVPAVAALGLHGHHHIDAVGSFMTCHSQEHPLKERSEYIGYVRKMFEYVTDVIGSVSTEMPFGQYFDVVDGFFHTYSQPSAWHRASQVGRYFLDRTVPVIPIALHNSVKCCESIRHGQHDLLRLLSLGIWPEYEVCMRPSPSFGIPAYETKADLLAQAYDLFYGNPEIAALADDDISARRELAPGISETLYAHGKRVLINQTRDNWHDLPAQSWRVM